MMSQTQALAIVSQEEAVAKLTAAGYMRETCPSCNGVGHFTETPANGDNWRRWTCHKCDGNGSVWRAPLTR